MRTLTGLSSNQTPANGKFEALQRQFPFAAESATEIVASLGVIASLILVARQIRQNMEEAKLANWGSMVDRGSTVYSQWKEIELAVLVVRALRAAGISSRA